MGREIDGHRPTRLPGYRRRTLCSRRTIRPLAPVDLRLTLAPLRHGGADPTCRFAADGFWRATRTPDGPATLHVRAGDGTVIAAEAWGPGAAWVLDGLPDLVGAGTDPAELSPRHPVVARLHRRMPGLRIPRTRRVLEALVPAIIDQKVTGIEARRSWRAMARAHGAPAPGPADLLLGPSPDVLARLPYHAFHGFGLERRRAETIRRVAAVAVRLEEVVALAGDAGTRRLLAVPGVGPWTVAEVAKVALGDRDAVSVGDYHLPNQVAWALAGEPRADDARMLALLDEFRPHRGHVTRLVECAGLGAPRYGPRQRLRDFRHW